MNKTVSSVKVPLAELIESVRYNFQLIQSYYRTGLFESYVQLVDYISTGNFPAWVEKLVTENSKKFILFEADRNFLKEENLAKKITNIQEINQITFRTAINLLYQQTRILMSQSGQSNTILVLDLKILIYECLEYFSKAPDDLGNEFTGYAHELNQILRTSGVNRKNAISKYVTSTFGLPDNANKKQTAKALKTLLLACLGGVSHLFHRHTPQAYKEGLEYVAEIHNFILRDFGQFKKYERPSLGLSGLAYFLTGLLQRSSGGDNLLKAENSFIFSLNAYSQRVLQKEFFFEKGWITEDKYKEQRSVSLRRTALVSTLGLSYLFLITGKLSRAEMALILPRAVLRQNSGRVYSIYSDMLFWAIQRAKHSNTKENIRLVISGLNKCLKEFQAIAPASNYEHRCNLELALAYRYAADFENKVKKDENYTTAEEYATKAINFAGGEDYKNLNNPKLFAPPNPHLLAEALFIRSHLKRSKPSADVKGALVDADNALKLVPTKSRDNSTESINIAADVLIANAAVWTRSAATANYNKHSRFESEFKKALGFLLEAIEINNNTNVRVNAVCYLRLSRLYLLKETELSRAISYFEKWKEISSSVEHAFCHVFAKSLEEKIQFPKKHMLLIDAEKSLNYEEWRKKLFEHLLNKAVEKARKEILKANLNKKQSKTILAKTLWQAELCSKSQAYVLINKYNLEEKLGLDFTSKI